MTAGFFSGDHVIYLYNVAKYLKLIVAFTIAGSHFIYIFKDLIIKIPDNHEKYKKRFH